MRSINKRILKGSIYLPLIALVGCATVENAQVVKPGDRVGVHFTCRLPNGEMAASTERDRNESDEPKSSIFVKRTIGRPLTVTAGEVKRSSGIKGQVSFEDEIVRLLRSKIIGMRSGEKRSLELASQRCEGLPKNEEYLSLVRVRRNPKELRIKIDEYKKQTGKAPEKGEPYTIDPAVPGSVAEVGKDEALIRFIGQKGKPFTTPFGSGVMEETDTEYVMPIEARIGALVRSGGLVGRIADADANAITLDYGHPFGGEALNCDVTVERIEPGAMKEAVPAAPAAPPVVIGRAEVRKLISDAMQKGLAEGNQTIDFDARSVNVRPGDLVTVDYTAALEDGTVFSTTLESVAKDPSRKKVSWYMQPPSYTSVEVMAGKQELIPGLGEALVEMAPGQKKQVKLSPEKAFGPSDPKKLVQQPCVVKIPRVIRMPADEYVKRFSSFPVANKEVDFVPYFKSRVSEVTEREVVLESLSTNGETVTESYGTILIGMDGEQITATLAPSIGALFPVEDGLGIITATDGKTFTVDGNHPLASKNIVLDLEVVSFIKTSKVKTAPIDWIEDHDAGLAEAKKEGKPLFLFLYADWCGFCKKTFAETLSDPRIKGMRDKFVWMKLNSDKEKKYKEQYGQNGFPMMVILKPDGTVLKKIEGYRDARGLKAELDGVL